MDFEGKALDLHVSEELLDINNNPVVRLLWDLGKNVFPVCSLIEYTINSTLEKSIDNKLTILLQSILDTKENITKEQLENIDTVNAFILTLDVVNKTIFNDKIALYGKLFANTYIGEENINFDEYQEWVVSLNELSMREFFILSKLYKYEEENPSNKEWGDICKYWDSFIKEIKETLKLSNEDIYSLLERMLRTGFYYNRSNIIGAVQEKYKKGHTTSYFKKFTQRLNGM